MSSASVTPDEAPDASEATSGPSAQWGRWVTGVLLGEGIAVCLLSVAIHPLLVVLLVAVCAPTAYLIEPTTRPEIRRVVLTRWRSWWRPRSGRLRVADLVLVVVVVVCALVCAQLVTMLSEAGTERTGDGTIDHMAASVAGDRGLALQLTWIAFIVVLGPLWEELVFRGYALRGLIDAITRIGHARAAVPVAAAITTSSFALMHSHLSAVGMLTVMVSGLAYTLLALRGGVGLAVFGHALWNGYWVFSVLAR